MACCLRSSARRLRSTGLYEAGLAWTFTGDAWKHEIWIDWQRVNTQDHRERFDAGATGELKVSRLAFIPLELHIVHEGGQFLRRAPWRTAPHLPPA